jgi:hypothetical protein
MTDGDDDDDKCGELGGMYDWQGKPECLDKTCPSAALFTTNSNLFELRNILTIGRRHVCHRKI